MGQVRKQTEGQVAAGRVTTQYKIGWITTLGVYEMFKKLRGLPQLRWVFGLRCEVVCKDEHRDVRAERFLQFVEPQQKARCAGHHIAAAWKR